jgi:hypothetical protein
MINMNQDIRGGTSASFESYAVATSETLGNLREYARENDKLPSPTTSTLARVPMAN